MLFLLPFIAAIGFAKAQKCNADNCARAVTGTVNGPAAQSTAKKDCESFFRTTISPGTVTSTATVSVFPFSTIVTITTGTVFPTVTVYPFTATVYSTTNTAFETITVGTQTNTIGTETITQTVATITIAAKRDIVERATTPSTITPTNVPKYASACSGTVRYSSACSCFGATRTTITLATPTTTITQTISATSTVISNVIATSTQTLSLTSTITSLVDYTITESATATENTIVTEISPVTATASPSLPAPRCDNAPTACDSRHFCNGSSGCGCYTTDLGQLCLQASDCGPACTSTSQCTPGRVCVLTSCCSGNCSLIGSCPNTSRLFRKAGQGLPGYRSGNDLE